jgi:hypothetical protein
MHGGHAWDTAFDLMGTFGTPSENVDALEAVAIATPEPSTVLGAGLMLGLGVFLRKQKKSKA